MAYSYVVDLVSKNWPKLHKNEILARLSYATYVSIERKYMYFEVPKSGCTSIKWLLHGIENLPPIASLTGSREVRRDMFIHERGQFRMRSIVDFPNDVQEEILGSPGFFRFTVVRNPYTRLESAWKDKVRLCAPKYEYMYRQLKGKLPDGKDRSSMISYAEFVDAISKQDLDQCDQHWRLQTSQLLMPSFKFSYVGRIERIDEAKQTLLSAIGEPPGEAAPAMNMSGTASYYDEHLAKVVYDLYRGDFESFDYGANSWTPGPSTDIEERTVPERIFMDEIVERNIILGGLYEAHDQLSRRLRIKPKSYLARYHDKEFDELFTQFIDTTDGWLAKEEAELLFRLAREVTGGCIVEIGSYRGRSATALALGSIAGHMPPVYCIEPHEEFVGPFGGQFGPIDKGHFMRRMVDLGLFQVVRLVNLSSELLTDKWPKPVKLLWIDGDHRFESVAKDFRSWEGKLDEDAAVVFDDAGVSGSGPHRLVVELVRQGKFEIISSIGKTVELRRKRT